MAAEDFVTKGECARSHDGLRREADLNNQNVTSALAGLSEQVSKLWDSFDSFRNSFRNHVPPWTAAIMTFEALAIGVFATMAFK